MTNVLAGALSVIIIVLPNPGDPQRDGQPPPSPDTTAPWLAPWFEAAQSAGGQWGGGPWGGAQPGAPGQPGDSGGGGLLGGVLGTVKLDGWKLTLPVASDKGTAASVSPADGAPPWLVRGDDGSVTFWAPVRGATTPHSEHARTELVSLRAFQAGAGRHTLRASLSVGQVPKQNQDIIIGQIHGAGDISSVPFVMLHYTAGTVHLVVKQERSGSTSQKYGLISGVPLGARFDYSINDTGDGNISVSATDGSTTRTATAPVPPAFRDATVRFQAGDYQQADANGSGSVDDGARVTFYALDETHDQGAEARP
jgi:hypothetical protein